MLLTEKHRESAEPCTWTILPEEVAAPVRDYERDAKEQGRTFAPRDWYYRCNVRRCYTGVFRCDERPALVDHLRDKSVTVCLLNVFYRLLTCFEPK